MGRLDAALTVLAYCQGLTCQNPWAALHPDGAVSSLQQVRCREAVSDTLI